MATRRDTKLDEFFRDVSEKLGSLVEGQKNLVERFDRHEEQENVRLTRVDEQMASAHDAISRVHGAARATRFWGGVIVGLGALAEVLYRWIHH